VEPTKGDVDATESEVIRRVRSGDAEAFAIVVERHAGSLYRLAYRIVGSPQRAEDVVQEALLRAYRALDRFDVRLELAPWLHRIAANAAIDELRRARRETPLAVDDGAGGWRELEPESSDPGPERRVAAAEAGRATERALAELSPDERAAFVLRHVEGRSIAEISRLLGKRDNATKQSIFRAVRKLRRALALWTEVPSEELA
jgi:RNA polymerase sigma-70 factor (ECF subfamily)